MSLSSLVAHPMLNNAPSNPRLVVYLPLMMVNNQNWYYSGGREDFVNPKARNECPVNIVDLRLGVLRLRYSRGDQTYFLSLKTGDSQKPRKWNLLIRLG